MEKPLPLSRSIKKNDIVSSELVRKIFRAPLSAPAERLTLMVEQKIWRIVSPEGESQRGGRRLGVKDGFFSQSALGAKKDENGSKIKNIGSNWLNIK